MGVLDRPRSPGGRHGTGARTEPEQRSAPPLRKPGQPAAAPPLSPAASGQPQEPKPSPMPPAASATDTPAEASAPRSEEPAVKTEPRPEAVRPAAERPVAPRLQPVAVISSPGGATAVLDGRADTACTTPCSLEAMPGRHTIALTLQGYQVEHREVQVGSGPLEIPAVVMRAHGRHPDAEQRSFRCVGAGKRKAGPAEDPRADPARAGYLSDHGREGRPPEHVPRGNPRWRNQKLEDSSEVVSCGTDGVTSVAGQFQLRRSMIVGGS